MYDRLRHPMLSWSAIPLHIDACASAAREAASGHDPNRPERSARSVALMARVSPKVKQAQALRAELSAEAMRVWVERGRSANAPDVPAAWARRAAVYFSCLRLALLR
jgi:hypothetical protein